MKKVKFLVLINLVLMLFVGCGAKENNEFKKGDFKGDLLENLKEKGKNLKESIEENKNSLKEKKITIVLDPGHSTKPMSGKEKVSPDSNETKLKETSGATGTWTKKKEPDTVMSVVLETKKLLEEKGYNVILTKNSAEESISNIERAEVGNKENADLLIRFHCDSFGNASAKGASVLIPRVKGYVNKEVADKSKAYGEQILEEYLKETKLPSRGIIYRDDLTGFNWSKVPVVLIEMGFISNKEEDLFIQSTENHSKIAKGIAIGIENCFK